MTTSARSRQDRTPREPELSLSRVIEQVSTEKGIDRQVLVETIEAAIQTAAKRTFGQQREIEAYFNEQSGEVELFQIIQVTEEVENPFRDITPQEADETGFDVQLGDELLVQIFYKPEDLERAKEQDRRYGKILKLESARSSFGRIAAQTAKQVIIQRVREAERDIIFNEFKDRKSELITGIIRRFEKGSIVVDLDRTDAILPRSEQTPRESYRAGDRIQAYVKDVQRSSRDPQIILSRSHPGLIEKLFEQEVPEIYEGIVRIVRVAREPGLRSKVAVYSRDADVDPVGACVGMRGSRVQAVVQELRGEKIDIVPYHDDPARFVCSAISPAEVSKVLIDEGNHTMELIVPDDQLSLAIGRGGQNVRLAAQLTGWNLDIISETRLKQIMADARAALLRQNGVSEEMIDTLFTLGYNKLEHIASASPQELAQIPGFGVENAECIIQAAQVILSSPQQPPASALTPHGLIEVKLLSSIPGFTERLSQDLHAAGYTTPHNLLIETSPERVEARAGIGIKKARQALTYAESLLLTLPAFDLATTQRQREAFTAFLAATPSASISDAYSAAVPEAPDASLYAHLFSTQPAAAPVAAPAAPPASSDSV
jgi:transcription termination/antitermination protein NusA